MMRVDDMHRAWRALPAGSLDDLTDGRCALILAPHPDDESLGCGGLIAASCQGGQPPVVAILTDGSMSHPGSKAFPPKRVAQVREMEARRATEILGLPSDRLIFLRQPDAKAAWDASAFTGVVQRVCRLVRQFDCSCILAPWRFDPHCDHEAAALIAAEVARRARIRHLAYPVWGWMLPADQVVDTVAPIGWRLDIGRYRDRKLGAVAAHESQYGDLITDDPSGFQLPQGLLNIIAGQFEVFLHP